MTVTRSAGAQIAVMNRTAAFATRTNTPHLTEIAKPTIYCLFE